MKKVLLPLLLNAAIACSVMGQAPAQINYQGVARNSVGNVLPNQNVSLRLTIHESSATGPVVYQETRAVKTNFFGMFTIAIGGSGATSTTGNIATVNWITGGSKYLQVEMDPQGKNNFVDMGASQLLSVPYAFAAAAAVPAGYAGGSLSGTYPNPGLAADAVHTINVADGSITAAKLAPGVIAGTGAAGGDLTGNYPNPFINNGAVNSIKLADNAVTTVKIADGSVTAAKLAAGLIPTTLPPSGNAGGDLNGTYPNPTLANGAVTTAKVADGSITAAKLAPGVIPTSIPVSGTAGGDLNGTYPNPTIANDAITTAKVADGSITAAKLAPGVIPTSIPVSGTAGGDLNGTYPNPTLVNDAVTTVKIANGSVTAAKLAAGVIPTTLPPSGSASGDLSGTFPNPAVSKIQGIGISTTAPTNGQVLKFNGTEWAPAAEAGGGSTGTAGGDLGGTYPNPTINNSAITTSKIADGSITLTKLASGVLPVALPPNGSAGGDLGGSFPNPSVAALQGITLSPTAPLAGQVLKYNGTSWAPGLDGNFALPYTATQGSATGRLLSITKNDAGSAIEGINSSPADYSFGVVGQVTNSVIGDSSAGVKGINFNSGYSALASSYGVWGDHRGYGTGVLGTSSYGFAGLFQITNPNNYNDAVTIDNGGLGFGLVATSNNIGIQGVANAQEGIGIVGYNNYEGEAIRGITWSDSYAAVVGHNGATFAAVQAINDADDGGGIGVYSTVRGGKYAPSAAIIGEIRGAGMGNPGVFRANGSTVARIDADGVGYFNGGVLNSGADIAEHFSVTGSTAAYEPGDVLVIATTADRTVEKSTGAYSTLVAGVYATKPGVVLTEQSVADGKLNDGVPMGVIGVIPTKVCTEGGAIKRGDLIVTSSTPGVAMKADPDKVRIGQVIGKALEDYNGTGIQKIKVLVSVK